MCDKRESESLVIGYVMKRTKDQRIKQATEKDTGKDILKKYLNGTLSYENAEEELINVYGSSAPLKMLAAVLEHKKKSKPLLSKPDDIFIKKGHPRAWSSIEDQRLVAGVYHYGTKNWNIISNFVGSRDQKSCLQRWSECLDPSIDKGKWYPEEDQKLRQAVKIYGEKAWNAVSRMMENRTDRQCRARYIRLAEADATNQPVKKQGRPPLKSTKDNSASELTEKPKVEEKLLNLPKIEKDNDSAAPTMIQIPVDQPKAEPMTEAERQLQIWTTFSEIQSLFRNSMDLSPESSIEQIMY